MTLKDIGTYKNKLLSLVLADENITELFLGKDYTTENPSEELLHKNIFPYLFADESQTDKKTYLCMDVDISKTVHNSYKTMKIIIWCYSHQNDIPSLRDGTVQTKPDYLAEIIDGLLRNSRNFGIGRLTLESTIHIEPSKEHYGRQLIYTCPEFN
jgi:hypothetical protein